jgi:hypothetical protein
MKTNSLKGAIIILVIGVCISLPSFSQKWGGNVPVVELTSWSVNINGGLTSYFGDLSMNDLNIGTKIKQESGPAMSIILTRNIYRDAIGLSGQVLTGKIEGRKDDISFSTDLIEYNLHARIDFVRLFMPSKYNAFGVIGYAGVGQFLFKTNKVEMNEGILKTSKQDTEVPEFVIFFGGSIYYKLNSNFGITADLSLHQCQNDRLDDYVKNENYDYFSYLSVGVSYYINAPKKNKASLANSSFLFSSKAHPAHEKTIP